MWRRAGSFLDCFVVVPLSERCTLECFSCSNNIVFGYPTSSDLGKEPCIGCGIIVCWFYADTCVEWSNGDRAFRFFVWILSQYLMLD